MPLYEYICKDGHRNEDLFPSLEAAPGEGVCPHCGSDTVRIASLPSFRLSWVPRVVDSVKEVWDGTPLEGTDGVNPLYYESKKMMFDQKAKS